MMSRMNMNLTNKITVGFDGESTTLFLRKEGEKLHLLNYEQDSEEIHRFGGGRKYYTSLFGLTGQGYLRSYGDMIPVGSYRVDLPHFNGATFKPLNEVWEISMPFAPHRKLTAEEIKHCPVVLRHCSENVVAFEPFDLRKLESRLSAYLSGEHDEEAIEDGNYTRSRNLFVKGEEGQWGKTSVNLQFVDGFAHRTIYSPWCFSHMVEGGEFFLLEKEENSILRKVFGLFHDGTNPKDPRVFGTGWMGENRVALKCYSKDPLQDPYSQPNAFRHNGWHLLSKEQVGDDIAVAYTCTKGEAVHIAAWRLCTTSLNNTFQPEGIVKDVLSGEFWLDREHLLSKLRKELTGKNEE